jgi:hypothetical protein
MEKQKINLEDKAWYLHLESIRKMEEALSNEDEELQCIINYIGYQTNRARS